MAGEDQVRGGRDGQELGDPFDDAEDQRVEQASRGLDERGVEAVHAAYAIGARGSDVQRVAIERLVLRDDRRPARTARARPPRRSVLIACQRSPSRRMRDRRRGHARRRRRPVAEEAGLAVAHDLGQAADVASRSPARRRERLERAQPERLALRRQQEEVGAGEQRRDRIDLAEEEHVVARRRARAPPPRRRRDRGRRRPSRAPHGISLAHAREDPHDVADALHRPEVRDVHQHLRLAVELLVEQRRVAATGRRPSGSMKLGMTSMRHAGAAERRRASPCCRYRETAVRPSDFSIENFVIGMERRVLADDRDVGAVQRRDDLDVAACVARASRARSTRSSRAGSRSGTCSRSSSCVSTTSCMRTASARSYGGYSNSG